MLFNADICTVIHMGRNNLKCEYKLGENSIRSSTKERDLGVVIDKTEKASEQCMMAVKNANIMLGITSCIPVYIHIHIQFF